MIRRWLGWFLAFMALSAVQTALFSAWPQPWRAIDVVIMALVGLIVSFRSRYAYAAAIAAGSVRDILTSSPFGMNVVILVVVVLALDILFKRVVTNVSLAAFAAMNAAGFLAARGLGSLAGLLIRSLTGSVDRTPAAPLTVWLVGFAVQIVLSLTLLFLFRRLKRRLAARFLFPRHAV